MSPEIAIPMWSSILNTLRWYEDSSDGARFRAASTTCVSLLRPTQALPCLTASIAYSTCREKSRVGPAHKPLRPAWAVPTWCSLPCGLHVVTSVSYWLRNMPKCVPSVGKGRAHYLGGKEGVEHANALLLQRHLQMKALKWGRAPLTAPRGTLFGPKIYVRRDLARARKKTHKKRKINQF